MQSGEGRRNMVLELSTHKDNYSITECKVGVLSSKITKGSTSCQVCIAFTTAAAHVISAQWGIRSLGRGAPTSKTCVVHAKSTIL